MPGHVILWRRFDEPGHEFCTFSVGARRVSFRGTAVFASRVEPCILSYEVEADAAGRTRWARVEGVVGRREVDLRIDADRAGRWRLNRRPCRGVEGCIDVDLNFSPSTNTLSIRRLALAVGESARVRSAWLRFPDFTLRPLEQVYRRVARDRYTYRSSSGFSATLDVSHEGLITRYGRVWKSVGLRSPI